MNCPNCGKEAEPGANFCSRCGASLLPSEETSIDRMIDDYRRTLEKKPDDADTHYNLALAYRLQGRDDLALIELERVTELAPDFADAYYQMGLIYLRQERFPESCQAATKALEYEPDHAGARRLRERLSGKTEE